MPHQLFIGGAFVDAEGDKTYETINPTDGSVSAGPVPPPPSPSSATASSPICSLTSPNMAFGGPGPGGLCLDTKGVQSVSSPSYRNGIEGRYGGAGSWGGKGTLKGLESASETESRVKPLKEEMKAVPCPSTP